MTAKLKSESNHENPEKGTPNYWSSALKGTPASIVVPPYIRFLQGVLLLRKALSFLYQSKYASLTGQANADITATIAELESSRESKELGVTFETYFASHLTINLVSEVEHF